MPTKKKEKVEIRSILIAEDVRQEIHGLQSIIGVYGNTINTSAPMLVMQKIMLRFELLSGTALHALCNIAIVSPSGKQVFASQSPVELEVKAGITAICCIGWSPAVFQEGGVYSIHFGINAKPKKVREFTVNLNKKPPESIGAVPTK